MSGLVSLIETKNHVCVCEYTKVRRVFDHVLENVISVDVDKLCITVIVVELINERSELAVKDLVR